MLLPGLFCKPNGDSVSFEIQNADRKQISLSLSTQTDNRSARDSCSFCPFCLSETEQGRRSQRSGFRRTRNACSWIAGFVFCMRNDFNNVCNVKSWLKIIPRASDTVLREKDQTGWALCVWGGRWRCYAVWRWEEEDFSALRSSPVPRISPENALNI